MTPLLNETESQNRRRSLHLMKTILPLSDNVIATSMKQKFTNTAKWAENDLCGTTKKVFTG